MADPAAIGVRGAPFVIDIERGKIREFAAATGSASPAFLADRPVSPPTFLTTSFFWQTADSDPWPAVALDQVRGLHAEQEYVFAGPPPRAGDRLTGQSWIADVFTKRGRRGGELTFAVMMTEFRRPDGSLAATARLTGVETGRPPRRDETAARQGDDAASGAGAAAGPEAPSDGRSRPADAESEPDTSAPAGVPAPPPARVVGPVTRTDFVRYQGASGDMNPIHHDETYAHAAGFPAPVGIGMWSAGLLAGYATDWLGAENVRSFRIRFSEQVWPGDLLTCTGRAIGVRTDGPDRLVDVDLACTRAGGGVAVRAWASFVTPETPPETPAAPASEAAGTRT